MRGVTEPSAAGQYSTIMRMMINFQSICASIHEKNSSSELGYANYNEEENYGGSPFSSDRSGSNDVGSYSLVSGHQLRKLCRQVDGCFDESTAVYLI